MLAILPILVCIKEKPLTSASSCSSFLLIHETYHNHFSRVRHAEVSPPPIRENLFTVMVYVGVIPFFFS